MQKKKKNNTDDTQEQDFLRQNLLVTAVRGKINRTTFTFHYQLMHLLIKTLSQFTFKNTHVKMSVMRT